MRPLAIWLGGSVWLATLVGAGRQGAHLLARVRPDYEGYDLVSDPYELHSVVYSGSDGVARFRSGGRVVFDALYPELVRLYDPRPPGYLPFPALPA